MRLTRLSLVSFFLVAPVCAHQSGPRGHASSGTLLFINANIHTLDPHQPRAEAIAVEGGMIRFAGSLPRARAELAPGFQEIDLAGRTVLPGLIDAHGHVAGLGAFGLGRLDLSRAASFDQLVVNVATQVRSRSKGEWILGGRWDHESWSSRELPSHRSLSEVTPDNPVWLRRVDGHAGLANAAALRIAGITRDTPSPPGGEIIKDANGEPTGVLVDNAMSLVERHAVGPQVTPEQLILKAQEMCLSAGLVGVHDAGVSPGEIEVYKRLESSGELKLRVYAMVAARHAMRYFEENAPYTGDRFTCRAAKLYMDGAMGSRGAWLLDPYEDRPLDDAGNAYTGLAVSQTDFIGAVAAHAVARGYQVCCHAIGDRANREVLDAYEQAFAAADLVPARQEDFDPDYRFRIEHAQLLSPADIPRFAAMGVVASMQPTHCTSDMRWVEARVGEERARGAYAWASLLRAGATIAAGSDFPVESHNPFLGIYAAITRRNESGEPNGGWMPQERMTREEALRAFTIGAAYAEFAEGSRGSLVAGKAADLIVIDRDVMTCEPKDILGTKVLMTVVGGEVVYRATDVP